MYSKTKHLRKNKNKHFQITGFFFCTHIFCAVSLNVKNPKSQFCDPLLPARLEKYWNKRQCETGNIRPTNIYFLTEFKKFRGLCIIPHVETIFVYTIIFSSQGLYFRNLS